jgi:hypothetical protein
MYFFFSRADGRLDVTEGASLLAADPSTVSPMPILGRVGHRLFTVRKSRRFVRTRIAVSCVVLLSAFGISVGTLVTSTSARANTLQNASDDSASGWYPNEPQLTPAVVSGGDFGELFDTQLNGQIYAQPLVVQPTVLAVTENDYAYGLNSTTGAIEWQHSYGPQADPLAQIGCADVGSSLGITGTPVIDPSTDVAYFAAATDGGSGGATEWFMDAVDVQTGATPSGWPANGVPIVGHADDDTNTVFNGERETQRPGLVLVNGVIYAAFGSQCDYGPWEGWLVGVSESSASITTMWSSEVDATLSSSGPGAGIWQSGSPPVVDSSGDIFVATGNGDDPSSPEPGSDSAIENYGEAVVELHTNGSGKLQVVDFFIAANADQLNAEDGDLGSGGPVALPASMGTSAEPNVMLEVGKQGIIYALNMADLGGYQQGVNDGDDVPFETSPDGGVWSKPAVWPGDGGFVYVPTSGGSLNAFQVVPGSTDVTLQLVAATQHSGNTFSFGSGTPIVTSNGTTSGSAVLWIIHASNSSRTDSQLEAFNPVPVNPGSSGTLEELWNSAFFTSTVFSAPGVDNGVVYVGTKDQTLLGFGLLSSSTPALAGNIPDFPSTVVSQSVTEPATFIATSPTTVSSFTQSGGAFSMGTPSANLPASLSTGQTISVPVTFTPTALGANPGTLTANVTGGTSELTLSGLGLTPTATFTISPTEVDFVAQPIGGSSVELPVTFTNVSGSSINITGFSNPALPFSVSGTPSDGAFGAGDALTFDVHFAPPGSSGDFDHEFASTATLDTSVGDFGVAISGSAAPPAQITTIPGTVNFGDVNVGSSATQSFEVGDQGGLPLTITLSTPPAINGFTGTPNPLLAVGQTLQGNTSDQESVTFTPTALGYVTATWLVEGTDGSGIQTVTLTGTGVNPPPPPPSPPPPPATTTTTTTAPLTLEVTTKAGRVDVVLILKAAGDPNGGTTTFVVKDGTAKACSIRGRDLREVGVGTCIVTAKKAANGATPAVSSKPTTITFVAPASRRQ